MHEKEDVLEVLIIDHLASIYVSCLLALASTSALMTAVGVPPEIVYVLLGTLLFLFSWFAFHVSWVFGSRVVRKRLHRRHKGEVGLLVEWLSTRTGYGTRGM